jgi:ATP-binding cassette, subfamily B, bacterial MsbA
LLVKQLIDSVATLEAARMSPSDLHRIHVVALEVLALFGIRAVAGFTARYLTDSVGLAVTADLRGDCNSRLQYLPLSFFDWVSTGNLLSLLLMDASGSSFVVTNTLSSLVGDTATLIGLMAGVFIMDWRLALLAFGVFPIAIVPVIGIAKRVRKVAREGRRQLADLFGMMQETAQGCRVVKSFGAEDYETRRFRVQLRRQLRMVKHIIVTSASVNPIIETLAAVGIVAVLWLGVASVIAGGRTPGTFAAFITAVLLVYRPFKRLAGTNNAIQIGLISADRLFSVIDSPPEIYDAPEAIELGPEPHSVELQNVSFRYSPQTEWVLRDVNLKIDAGEVVALAGMSGGGKTTLSELIPRFYDPEEGTILIDGVDARCYSLRSLRARISIVSQHTFLFNDTIRANIAYGSHERSFAEIVAAARLANAHDFIMGLPKGYDTKVGEFGVGLSGGERQRLAIARALLKDAPILILDEPTSNLDAEAERVVQEAIEPLMKNRSTLIIAHRLSTVKRADRILVIVTGKVVEQGTHEELMALGGAYRKLHEFQYEVETPFDQAPRDAANG